MKAAVYVCIVLSALVCVCWPFAAFLSIFAFDAPSRGAADMLARYIGVAIFLAYPWGLVAGLVHFAAQKNKTEWKPMAYVCASARSVSSPRAFLRSNESDLEVKEEG
jgi:hypothetical protein